jgi:CRP/FNR family transcriptional regulator, nitrogen oxide reductase regulator
MLNTVNSAEGVRRHLANQRIEAINRFALFAEVPTADCQSIVSMSGEKRFSRRETMFSEGNPVRDVVMLLSGCVKVTQTGLNGNEVILRLNGPGEIVGSFRLCVHCSHCSTAQTVQDSSALVWDAATFEKLLVKYPTFRRNTLRALEERLRDMEERFREVSTEKVGSRLSSELLRLSGRLGRVPGGPMEITLSRAELAQLIGTTLFTVSRLLCQWQTQGIVTIRREAVMVRDVNALAQLSHVE